MGTQAVDSPVEDVLSDTPALQATPTPRPSGGPSFPNPDLLQPQGPLVDLTPPPGYMGAGVPSATPAPSQGPLAAIASFITKPPANTRPSFGESQSIVPSPPLGLAMPPAASLLGRSALQGGAAGVEALQQGKGPLDIAKEIGKGAAFNVGAEKALGPLARFVGKQFGAKEATAAYEGAQAARAAKSAHDEVMTSVLNTLEKAGFEKAVTGHSEKAASKIAAALESQVPALAGMEKSGKGLYDAIYGSGKQKVSQAFDQAFKDVAEKGKGQVVQLPSEIAEKLNLTNAGAGVAGLPANVQALFNRGAQKAGMKPAGTPGMIGVDAAELAQKALGLWKKDPQSYRAAVNALDDAGIGDPAARAAYKAYSGYADFIDKAKGLDANGTLNPSNILKALADLKKVNVLRNRGLGSGTEGVIQESVRGGPLAPTPRQVPVQPPEPVAPDITSIKNPLAGHPYIGGAVGGVLGHAAGLSGGVGHGLGIGAGALASALLPKEIVTKGPLSAGARKAATNLPDIAGILARLIGNKMNEKVRE